MNTIERRVNGLENIANNQKTSSKHSFDVKDEVSKHKIKDSVFTNLFKDKKYLLQLYKALHPEDTNTTEDQLTYVTIENILINGLYNDLGFMVGNRLLILTEAQSTWSVNIIIRVLLYLAQTYHDYLAETKQPLYTSKQVQIPEPELYVIYTGERQKRPDELSLSREFFSGKDCAVDVKVRMLYDGTVSKETGEGDIINQYIIFTKVCNEQVKLYGRTKKAILETIRICKDRNVLKDYLESREKEVIDIMMVLYDEEEAMKTYVESERYDAQNDVRIEMALDMLREGEPIEKIVRYCKLSKEKILELQQV